MSLRISCWLPLLMSLVSGWAGPAGTPQSDESYKPNQRILKIRELGKKDATVLPTLAQYLSDPNPDIRVEAVRAIVRIDTPASLDALVQAARDSDPDVQIRAADGIVNVYVPGYVAKNGVSGLLTRGVRQVKSFLATRNDQVVDPDVVIRPDAAQALSNQVASGSSVDVRANAALAAGILRNQAAVPALVQALHARDNSILFETLIALEKIHDPTAGPGISFLAHDLDEKIQATALEAIGVLRSLPSAPDVRSALQNARNARIRRAAIEALAMLGIPGDRPVFLQYLGDGDPMIRAASLEGLGRIREPDDFPVLQKGYDEPDADWRVHLAAAFAMVEQGKTGIEEFDPLSYLVESLSARNRADFAKAYLTELARHPEVRAGLSKIVPAAPKDQKLALCSVFAASQDPDTIPVLNLLAKDIDSDVAFAASRALRIVQARRSS